MGIGWQPTNSSVTRCDADPVKDAPKNPNPRPKRRGKIKPEPPGPIKGMVRLKHRQQDGSISSFGDEVSIEHGIGQLTPVQRHIASAYESGLIDDSDLDALL